MKKFFFAFLFLGASIAASGQSISFKAKGYIDMSIVTAQEQFIQAPVNISITSQKVVIGNTEFPIHRVEKSGQELILRSGLSMFSVLIEEGSATVFIVELPGQAPRQYFKE